MGKSSKILLGISGVLIIMFVVICADQTLNRKKYVIDNVFQLFTGYIFYAVYFIVPAGILAACALFPRKKTILLIFCALIGAFIAAFVFLVGSLWIFAVPAVFSAVVCVIFAVKHKNRGKI